MTRINQRSAIYVFCVALIAALVVMVAPKVFAHTPTGGASCGGYFVKAVSYESRNTNIINSTFDGVKTERHFATNDQITGSWPQDGIEHTWSGFVHTNNSNPAYSKNYGPIKLTCGHKQDVKDASVSLTVTPATCDAAGSVAITGLVNAVEIGQLDETPGTHSATFNANQGHRFADNSSSKTISYTIDPKDVTQHCFVQPPDDRETQTLTSTPSCKHSFVMTRNQERTRSYFWDGVAYVPGAWSAWVTTSALSSTVELPKCDRFTQVRVTVTDKCNCWRDKVVMHHGSNVRVSMHKANRLTWVFKVTGKKVNGHQYFLPRFINGNHGRPIAGTHRGWAITQVYKVHTTNVACPCHLHHNCPPPSTQPPHHHCKGRCKV